MIRRETSLVAKVIAVTFAVGVFLVYHDTNADFASTQATQGGKGDSRVPSLLHRDSWSSRVKVRSTVQFFPRFTPAQDEPIRCRLENVSLRDCSEYVQLSYACADPSLRYLDAFLSTMDLYRALVTLESVKPSAWTAIPLSCDICCLIGLVE